MFETSPRAVTIANLNGVLGRKVSQSSKNMTQDSMIANSMPDKRSTATFPSMGNEDEYVQEEICFCLKVKRKIDKSRNDSKDSKNDLKTHMLAQD